MHARLVFGIIWSFLFFFFFFACCRVLFGAWGLWSIHKRALSHLSRVGRDWNYRGLALSDVMTEGDV